MNLGQHGEALAQHYLSLQGLKFVASNVRFAFGEIDLIMQHDDVLVFIEVKYRTSTHFGGAINALRPAQIQRIRRAASAYLQQQQLDVVCRFDVIAIDNQHIQWLKAAF